MYISDLITALNALQQVTGDRPISDIIVSDYDGIQFQTRNMYYFYNYEEENIFKSTTPIITDDDITYFDDEQFNETNYDPFIGQDTYETYELNDEP